MERAGFQVVGQSGTGEDLMLKVTSYKPDVAIVDLRMPPTHTDEGMRAARQIRDRYPEVGVLVLSQYVEAPYMMELLQGDIEGVGYRPASLHDRVDGTSNGGRQLTHQRRAIARNAISSDE